MPIDQQFVDVDFRVEVPPGEGLGCMHETAAMMASRTPDVQRFADNRLIPKSEWQELATELDEELRSGVRNVHNQGKYLDQFLLYRQRFSSRQICRL